MKFPFSPVFPHGGPDRAAQLVLADWCEEQGLEDHARALRWCASGGKRPYPNIPRGYFWFNGAGVEAPYLFASDLPKALFRLLGETYCPSEEDAYQALGQALQKFAEKGLTSPVKQLE